MLLPAVFLRAEAMALELCTADGLGSLPSKSHVHDGSCSFCPGRDFSPLIPASRMESSELIAEQPYSIAAMKDRPVRRLHFGSPPITGPPQVEISSVIV
jgi:hypothetical protein